MFTVVVCSECKFVWIIQGRPDVSQCGRCRKRTKFSKLKKYFQSSDMEAARLARSHAQAKVNKQGLKFEKAMETGVLEQEIEDAVTETEYLNEKGIGARNVIQAVEESFQANSIPNSKFEIVERALTNHEATSLDEFVNYTSGHGLHENDALKMLKKRFESDDLDVPAQFVLGEIEERLDETNARSGSHHERSHSGRDIILNGISELDRPTEEGIVQYAVSQGLKRNKTTSYLSKLIEGGEVSKKPDGSLRVID